MSTAVLLTRVAQFSQRFFVSFHRTTQHKAYKRTVFFVQNIVAPFNLNPNTVSDFRRKRKILLALQKPIIR